jgi:hypothetical protein
MQAYGVSNGKLVFRRIIVILLVTAAILAAFCIATGIFDAYSPTFGHLTIQWHFPWNPDSPFLNWKWPWEPGFGHPDTTDPAQYGI